MLLNFKVDSIGCCKSIKENGKWSVRGLPGERAKQLVNKQLECCCLGHEASGAQLIDQTERSDLINWEVKFSLAKVAAEETASPFESSSFVRCCCRRARKLEIDFPPAAGFLFCLLSCCLPHSVDASQKTREHSERSFKKRRTYQSLCVSENILLTNFRQMNASKSLLWWESLFFFLRYSRTLRNHVRGKFCSLDKTCFGARTTQQRKWSRRCAP